MKKSSLVQQGLAAIALAASLFSSASAEPAPAPWESPALSGLTGVASAPMTVGKSIVTPLPTSGNPKSFVVITELKLPSHWHAYWLNPATVGIPMEASMNPVDGFSISGPYWAVPQRGQSDLGVFYGYENPRVAFVVTPEKPQTSAEFTTKLSWQICRDGECLPPEEQSFTTSIPPSAGENHTTLTGLVGLSSPQWSSGMKSSASIKGNTVTLSLEFAPGKLNVATPPPFIFFSNDGEIMPTAAQKAEKTSQNSYTITLQRNLNEDSLYPNRKAEDEKPLPPMTKLEGVLALNGEGVNLDIPLSSPSSLHTQSAKEESLQEPSYAGLLSIVIGLFVGGVILNLMPCVFPVIGLKILSFVKLGGGDRKKVLTHSLSFVTGVLISFWILTVILILVKAGLADEGQKITWAFWMEKPYVIFGLILVMLIMSLSMYGVFEIGVTATSTGSGLQNKEGYMGSFWSGVLATIVATPCTAPFLSGVMAPALALPSTGMFIAFTAMGLGMSFPYIILGAFPHLVKYLPRPGAWMESFKQGISFILLAATGWLFWVYMVNFEDSMDLFNAILGLVAVCAACWVYGRWCPIYQTKKSRLIGGIIALALFCAGAWYAAPPPQADQSPSLEKGQMNASPWSPWSPQAVEKALADGHPVYVDFTARWCATCQTNKKLAYTPDVMELFRKNGVVLLKADKTKPNSEIDRAMAKLGRAAVPLNVLYLPNGGEPHITREILTAEYMKEFISQFFPKK